MTIETITQVYAECDKLVAPLRGVSKAMTDNLIAAPERTSA